MAGVKPGRHFACEYLSKTRYLNYRGILRAVNKPQMAGVMLFDNLLHNYDRTLNRRNLLLRREGDGYHIYAIDNSHLFRRGLWNEQWLEKLAPQVKINRYRSYGTLLAHCLRPEYFNEYVSRILQISDDDIEAIVTHIPCEWLPHEQERQALKSFLATRRDMAVEIATCICALIPNKNRRTDTDKGK